MDSQGFEVTLEKNFISLKTWGTPNEDNVAEPADTALALAKEKHVDLLLDDIRGVNTDRINIHVQAKGTPALWRLKFFKQVAIVVNNDEMGTMLHDSLAILHLNKRIRSFYDKEEAIKWLQEQGKDQK